MIAVKSPKALEVGLYTPAEAAFYARLKPRTMNGWLFGTGGYESVVDAEIGTLDGERFVTFLDFVQMLAIRDIRQTKNVSLQKLRRAVKEAEERWNLPQPFARKHSTYLYPKDSSNPDVLIRKPGHESLVQVTGKHKGNQMILEVAELYMEDISWDPDGVAIEYRAWKRRDVEIKMNPRVRFGEPIVTTCGYTAAALWDAYRSEGGIENAAKCYGVSPEDVKAAVEYFKNLQALV